VRSIDLAKEMTRINDKTLSFRWFLIFLIKEPERAWQRYRIKEIWSNVHHNVRCM